MLNKHFPLFQSPNYDIITSVTSQVNSKYINSSAIADLNIVHLWVCCLARSEARSLSFSPFRSLINLQLKADCLVCICLILQPVFLPIPYPSPTQPHTTLIRYNMALKRINKELTDLGRYVSLTSLLENMFWWGGLSGMKNRRDPDAVSVYLEVDGFTDILICI